MKTAGSANLAKFSKPPGLTTTWLEALKELAITVAKGFMDKDQVKRSWQPISEKITIKEIKYWSGFDLAYLFFLVSSLPYDFVVIPPEIYSLISKEPDPSDVQSHDWWETAIEISQQEDII